MKKIIKGRQLNTATAKMVGTVMIDENKDIVETLYRTKSGIYFIHNVYKKSTTGKIEVGENLNIVPIDEAKEWAKKWLTEIEYNEYFGENTSDETVTITVNITSKAFQTLKREKELTGDTYGEIISCTIIRDNRTKLSKGYGFAVFKDADSVWEICKSSVEWSGRVLNISLSSSFCLPAIIL